MRDTKHPEKRALYSISDLYIHSTHVYLNNKPCALYTFMHVYTPVQFIQTTEKVVFEAVKQPMAVRGKGRGKIRSSIKYFSSDIGLQTATCVCALLYKVSLHCIVDMILENIEHSFKE